MTYDEAFNALKNGGSLTGRFLEGEYVTMENGVMTLHATDGDIVDWTPSNSDRLSEDWVVS
jgi:hypothetical protein